MDGAHPEVARLIAHYGLSPLPIEGTLFAQTYRSPRFTVEGGPVGTAIVGLYAHRPLSQSLFHRLASDEIWHFYGGDPIRLVLLDPDGTSDDLWLGPDLEAGQQVQGVIPAGVWQAGHLVEGGTYGLFGCTMAPGFTAADFEGGRVGDLLRTHPDRAVDIRRLGIPDDAPAAMPEA
jgi:predicted cupin superfamily sugar epimerase